MSDKGNIFPASVDSPTSIRGPFGSLLFRDEIVHPPRFERFSRSEALFMTANFFDPFFSFRRLPVALPERSPDFFTFFSV